MVRFRGAGGPPRVMLEGPGGQRVAASADGSPVVGKRFTVLQDPTEAATHVAIRNPGGTWRVTTPEGSPAVTSVDTATVLPRPSVSARVRGRGSKRALVWRLRRLPGQRVTFVEKGRDSTQVIARTSRATGRARFNPADGKARSRRILAVVEQSGAPRDTLRVARYRAPALRRPGKPRKLRVRRRGSRLVVSWRPAAGAQSYMAFVRAADGERELFVVRGRKRRLRVRGVQRSHRATVQVTGIRFDGVGGRPATAKVKPVRRSRSR